MSFDNEKFTAWLQEFERALIECGMPERQALKYRTEYYTDAVAHFSNGFSPDAAAIAELLNV